MKHGKPDFLDWLGLRRSPELFKIPWLGGLVTVVVSVGFVILLLSAIIEFANASWSDDPNAEALRNAGLVLAAIIGIPFLVWRAVVAQKQADVAEQALFNDKLKAAADDLHARRDIKRKNRLKDAAERDFIEDDIVRRVAAIDRLEGLAEERPSEAPRITRLLCVYLRHLSKGITPDNEEHPRADMEAAAQTIGRMKRIPGVEADEVKIDLQDANLAGFDLSGLCFDGAWFNEAELSRTNFFGSAMQRAVFFKSNLRKATLSAVQLQHAVFNAAEMQMADLSASKFHNAKFDGALMQGTYISDAVVNETTSLSLADLRGAALHNVDFSGGTIEQWQVDRAFYDRSVKFPEDIVSRSGKDKDFDTPEFRDRWRAWQKEIGFDPDNPATW